MAPRPPGSLLAEGSRYYALGHDPPNAPSWIWNIAVATGNDVDVSVASGLAGRRAVFKTDIEAIGPEVF